MVVGIRKYVLKNTFFIGFQVHVLEVTIYNDIGSNVVFPAHNHWYTFEKRVNRIPVERKANSRVGKARGFSGELFARGRRRPRPVGCLHRIHIVYCTPSCQQMYAMRLHYHKLICIPQCNRGIVPFRWFECLIWNVEMKHWNGTNINRNIMVVIIITDQLKIEPLLKPRA